MSAFNGPDLDPTDWDSVRAQGHRMLDDMIDHLRDLRGETTPRDVTLLKALGVDAFLGQPVRTLSGGWTFSHK